jgi:DNA polymerase III delta subunit
VKKDAAVAKLCAKAGDVLIFDAAKRGRVAWVAERFRQAGVKAEPAACALLIEYVGETDLHGLAGEVDKIATWAQGEPVGVTEIEQLVTPIADVPPFVLTDAWAERNPGRLL